MSAGTLTLTNNSPTVTGSGTAFTTELSAGDYFVVTVGGIPYTLPVKSVNNATSLTLISNYTGPTQAGAAWSAVPRVAMSLVTAALVAQSTEALRGLNYDKQNWQRIFSGSGTVIVNLPDGSSFSGPAWGGITAALSTKAAKGSNNDITSLNGLTTALSVAQGGTGAKDAAAARTNLDLGYGTTANTVAQGNDIRLSTIDGKSGGTLTSGVTVDSGGSATGMTIIGYGDTDIWHDQISVGGTIRFRSGLTGIGTNPLIMWQARVLPGDSLKTPLLISANDVIYTSRNTTKATDGTLKVASPVVQLFGSGRAEMNEESEGCIVTRIDIGVYKIEGCIGLNADAAWGGINGGFEIPTDRNKQPLIWLDYDVNADGSVLVKTYHREHPSAPAFARNTLDGIADGDPVDIPSDQFISVRVEMPADSIWNLAQAAAQENQQDAQQ